MVFEPETKPRSHHHQHIMSLSPSFFIVLFAGAPSLSQGCPILHLLVSPTFRSERENTCCYRCQKREMCTDASFANITFHFSPAHPPPDSRESSSSSGSLKRHSLPKVENFKPFGRAVLFVCSINPHIVAKRNRRKTSSSNGILCQPNTTAGVTTRRPLHTPPCSGGDGDAHPLPGTNTVALHPPHLGASRRDANG